ncbi:hypothetical protein M2319_001178 [Rhodobium gokarnense]|uniref:Uncharacterized protein n=1 Tax=Rhodobium gokarnense TaxID=364296 RepID=A0ABT3H982_9HYPH|nr:hypothetical protein [Rhodobium gokarnense]
MITIMGMTTITITTMGTTTITTTKMGTIIPTRILMPIPTVRTGPSISAPGRRASM